MTKRADKVEVGDVLAGIGPVTYTRIHQMDKAPVSYAGMQKRGRVVCPPFRTTAKVVELRVDGQDTPLYRWPMQKLEVTA